MPLCLELTTGFSRWWAPAVSVWGLLLPWLMVDSRLCKLSLQLIFVTLSWSTTIALSFLEFAEEDCFRHAYVFYPCDVASPAHLPLKQGGLYAGQAGSLEDFFVRRVALPFDAKNGAQAALAWSASDREPRSLPVQERGNDDGPLYLDLRGEAERMALPYSLWQSSKGTAGFWSCCLYQYSSHWKTWRV